MSMTKEQWEEYALATYGSIEEGRNAQREKGTKGGNTTKSRGHLAKIGFQNVPLAQRLEAHRRGGQNRRRDESSKNNVTK